MARRQDLHTRLSVPSSRRFSTHELARAWLATLAATLLAQARAEDSSPAVDLELVLAVDVSSSMTKDELRVQRGGYVSALRDPQVVSAILSGARGRIAIAYFEWAKSRTSTSSHALDCRRWARQHRGVRRWARSAADRRRRGSLDRPWIGRRGNFDFRRPLLRLEIAPEQPLSRRASDRRCFWRRPQQLRRAHFAGARGAGGARRNDKRAGDLAARLARRRKLAR